MFCRNLPVVKKGHLNTVILHISSSAPHHFACLEAPATRTADNSGFVSYYFMGHPPLMGFRTGSEALFLSTVKARLSSCLPLLSCALIVGDVLTVPVLPMVCSGAQPVRTSARSWNRTRGGDAMADGWIIEQRIDLCF